jgi:leucyl aminopeptidase
MAIDTSVLFANPAAHTCDLLALLVREGAVAKGKLADARLSDLDGALGGLLRKVAGEEEFTGKDGQQLSLHTHGKAGPARIVVLGLGKGRDADKSLDGLRTAAARAVKAARAAGAKTLALAWPEGEHANVTVAAEVQALTEGASLGAYRFDKYLREKKPLKVSKLQLLASKGPALKDLAAAAAHGQAVADAVCLARDLVNEPAGRITPRALAAEAKRAGAAHGFSVEVLGRAQIKKLGMHLFLGVAQGSVEEPQLVKMSWSPPKADAARAIALVGKAITFDSGGLSIKTASGMEDMKTDMAGAAAVISAMALVARLKPPFPVHAYFGACENLPSGTAYKPGDVITGKSGLSVEILNTDAEGRLVLADVLAWAVEGKPAAVVDLATLTGAIMVALGPWTTGLFSNDDALADELLKSARAAGESAWRMPLPPEMEELIKSPIADLKNTGGRFGGSINAALFLQHFVRPAGKPSGDSPAPKIPWAHLDIAGPSSIDRERGYTPRGGTGAGVRLLAEWIRRRAS